jgi:hypothetical protein
LSKKEQLKAHLSPFEKSLMKLKLEHGILTMELYFTQFMGFIFHITIM